MTCADCKKPVAALYACALCGAKVCRTCGQALHICADLRPGSKP